MKLFFFLCIVLLPAVNPVYSKIYDLNYTTDIPLALTGLALLSGAYYGDSRLEPLKQSEIDSAKTSDINRFDRNATDNWSGTSDRLSDYSLYSLIAGPVLLTAYDEPRNDILTITVMYMEALAIETGLTGIVKTAVKRKRPYVYNSKVPLNEKLNTDSKKSFYSGHTSTSFTSAVFLSTVYGDYFPASNSKWFVWTISLGMASFTGWLRYNAGMHFPTDILAGAAAGSLIGWLVPAIHRKNTFSIIPLVSRDSAALIFQYRI